jgi:hypothetical protein
MTDRPATAAGRELLAILDPYNREDEWTHRRVSDILAIEEQARAELRSQVERLREDIQGVLDDAESQHPGGWGPDVTTVAILRTLLADTATASEEPQDKPSHRHDWVAWGGDGTWDYCTDPDCRATRSHWEDPR